MTPADAAAGYMRQGLRVFPTAPRSKVPLPGSRGVLDASANPRTDAIWRKRPDLNIALATGPDVWALDRDGDEGRESLAKLEAAYGTLPATVTSQTPNGEHSLWRTPEGVVIKNSAGQVAPGLDVRGRNGYIVVPPSWHPDGSTYEWLPGRSPFEIPVAVPPDWLVEIVTQPKRRQRLRPARPMGTIGTTGPRYVQAAIESEALELAAAPEGTRNDRLNKAAYVLARFVSGGQADAAAVVRVLQLAAGYAGLDDREVDRTIGSAFRARGVPL